MAVTVVVAVAEPQRRFVKVSRPSCAPGGLVVVVAEEVAATAMASLVAQQAAHLQVVLLLKRTAPLKAPGTAGNSSFAQPPTPALQSPSRNGDIPVSL